MANVKPKKSNKDKTKIAKGDKNKKRALNQEDLEKMSGGNYGINGRIEDVESRF